MYIEWINDQYGLTGLYLFILVSFLILYLVLATASYLYFFSYQRKRYHPDYQLDKPEIIKSIKWALYNALVNSLIIVFIELLIIKGNSKIYFDFSDHSPGYTLLSILMVLIIAETLIYWIHRALHTRILYRYIHSYHHRFREPTPYTSLAFHPLDALFQGLPYHLCAFLFPLNFWVYHASVVLATLWSLTIHDRVRLVPSEWINHTGCHMVHHWFFAYNYGQFFTFWDRLCGTHRSADCLPDKFYSSWPKRSQTRNSNTVPGLMR